MKHSRKSWNLPFVYGKIVNQSRVCQVIKIQTVLIEMNLVWNKKTAVFDHLKKSYIDSRKLRQVFNLFFSLWSVNKIRIREREHEKWFGFYFNDFVCTCVKFTILRTRARIFQLCIFTFHKELQLNFDSRLDIL